MDGAYQETVADGEEQNLAEGEHCGASVVVMNSVGKEDPGGAIMDGTGFGSVRCEAWMIRIQ